MRFSKHDPTLAERQAQAAEARKAQAARFKPKPTVLTPYDGLTRQEKRAARLAAARAKRALRPRCEKPQPAPLSAPVVVETPRVARDCPEPVRFTVAWEGPGVEFEAVVVVGPDVTRRKAAARRWRSEQWRQGNRSCTYCDVKLVMPPKRKASTWLPGPTAATVDHAEPVGLGGDDAAWNWRMCCWACNNRKAMMPEATFRALLARERVAVAAE